MIVTIDIRQPSVEVYKERLRLEKQGLLSSLLEEGDRTSNKRKIPDVMPGINMMRRRPGLRELIRIMKAIIQQKDVKAKFELITQPVERQKLDEAERTKQISNRLKREANIFQLIKYSNHLISIFPKLQITNYIEA